MRTTTYVRERRKTGVLKVCILTLVAEELSEFGRGQLPSSGARVRMLTGQCVPWLRVWRLPILCLQLDMAGGDCARDIWSGLE